MKTCAHLEYFLLGSSLLDVLFGQELLQAAKAITIGAEMNAEGPAAPSKWWRYSWHGRLTPGIQVCVCALYEVQTGFAPGCLQTLRPYRRIQDGNRLRCRLAPAGNEEKKRPVSLTSLGLGGSAEGRTPGPHLHVKQIELDWISGVHVLVRVEELAPEEEGLVLVHPLLSEGPAVIQPVHWQKKPQGATISLCG